MAAGRAPPICLLISLMMACTVVHGRPHANRYFHTLMSRLSTCPRTPGPGVYDLAAAVFLPRVELHKHQKSRTDQFPMYVAGEAEGFSLDDNGNPVLTPIIGGDHCHNSPGAPHAFLPKVGKPIPDNWEIAFVAITPRNLQEDTQSVSPEVKAAYTRVTGYEAPTWV